VTHHIAMHAEATPKPFVRGGESGRHLTLFCGELADQVGRILFVDDRGLIRQRGLGIDDGGQRFDVDGEPLGGIRA
jgi:hypothetical protein